MQRPTNHAGAEGGLEEFAVTKLAPQVRDEGHVVRQNLLDLLDDVLTRRLTVVHAGAGYGKTSLLMQWLNAVKRRRIAAIWLTLEEEEAVAAKFLGHTITALTRRGYVEDDALSPLGQFDERVPVKSLAAAFVNVLAKTAEPLVLFLDEYNRAQSEETDGLLRLLVRNIPSHVHFVIASRRRPEIDIENLRARGDLVEVSPADLRFSEQEVKELFEHSGTGLGAAELYRLTDRTEGWPIALQMARLWLKGDGKRANLVSDFSGRTTDLARYLTEQVLSGLAHDQQDFIMQTAILDRINGDVANAVTGRHDGWIMIERFFEKSLFLVPDSADQQWFRYHTLFRDFLRDRLERHYPDTVTELHGRAARWFAEQGMVRQALDHALAAKDAELAADVLLAAGGWRLIMDGRINLVRNAISAMPAQLVDEHIGLALAKMFLIVKDGDIKGGRDYFNSLKPRRGQQWSPEARTDWKICGHILSDYADDPVSFSEIDRLRNLRAEISLDDHVIQAILCDSLSTTYYRFGLLSESLKACDEAIVHYRAMKSLYGEVFSRLGQARAYIAQARLDDADRVLWDTEKELGERFGESIDLSEHTSIYIAHVLKERGLMDEAAERLERALPVAEQSDGWFDLYEVGYGVAAAVAWDAGGIDDVLAVSRRARDTARARGLDRVALAADLQDVYYLCLAGRVTEAERYITGLEESFAREEPEHPLSFDTTVVAILAFLRANERQFALAEQLLVPMIEIVERRGEVCRLVLLNLILADTKASQGDFPEAAKLLARAVHVGQFTGLRRPYLEMGVRLKPVIDFALKGSNILPDDRYRDSFLRNLKRDLRRKDKRSAQGNISLTPGEIEVLRELDHGLSNKEIARELGISPNTVKYRIKGLFSKLGVSRRADAVKRSRELSLLSADDR